MRAANAPVATASDHGDLLAVWAIKCSWCSIASTGIQPVTLSCKILLGMRKAYFQEFSE
jgi:hypothetical protein